jgi:hypothetical protein
MDKGPSNMTLQLLLLMVVLLVCVQVPGDGQGPLQHDAAAASADRCAAGACAGRRRWTRAPPT